MCVLTREPARRCRPRPRGAVRARPGDRDVAAWSPPGPWRAHCSGAHRARRARRLGLASSRVHPLMTFRSDGDPRQLDGVHAAVSGARRDGHRGGARARARSRAAPVRSSTTPRARSITAPRRCGGSVTTAAFLAAVRALGHVGLEPAQAARVLAPLATRAIANAAALPDASSLTGPVARGDAVTMRAATAPRCMRPIGSSSGPTSPSSPRPSRRWCPRGSRTWHRCSARDDRAYRRRPARQACR